MSKIKGSLTVSKDLTLGTALAVAQGGSGSTTASGARTNLGVQLPFFDSVSATGNQTISSASFVDITNSSKSVTFPTGTSNILLSYVVGGFNASGTSNGRVQAVIGGTTSTATRYDITLSGTQVCLVSVTELFVGPFSGATTVKLQGVKDAGTDVQLDVNSRVYWNLIGFYTG